jgi:hypothetical protein
VLVAILPLILLYRLAFPPAIPTLKLPEPNGWDDLMAAGEMIGPDLSARLRQWIRTKEPLPAELYRPDVVALFRRGLEREIVIPFMYQYDDWPETEMQKFSQLHAAVNGYAAAAERSKDVERQLGAYWDLLRLTNEEGRVVGPPGQPDQGAFQWESMSLEYYWRLRTKLSREQCGELLSMLVEYDKRRDSWEDKWARQRIADAHADWETRLRLIVSEWAGDEFYGDGYEPFNPIVSLRLLITDLAVREYQMNHGKLPVTVDALVPEFLPAVPQDPFGKGPVVYRKVDDGYRIYSIGPDLDDDGGVTTDRNWNGDYTPEMMFR